MAKTVTNTTTARKAYGKEISEFNKGISEVKFSFTFEELEKGDEIPADEMPDTDGIRSFVNQRRAAAARSAAQNKALADAGIQKPTLEDADVRLETIVKALVANKETRENAEKMARQMLGM